MKYLVFSGALIASLLLFMEDENYRVPDEINTLPPEPATTPNRSAAPGGKASAMISSDMASPALEITSDHISDVIRVGPDLDVPNISYKPSEEVISVGEPKLVGSIDHSKYFTDEIEIDGDVMNVEELVENGLIEQVIIEGEIKTVGVVDYSQAAKKPILVGKRLVVKKTIQQ
jgi:hypothetical protein